MHACIDIMQFLFLLLKEIFENKTCGVNSYVRKTAFATDQSVKIKMKPYFFPCEKCRIFSVEY